MHLPTVQPISLSDIYVSGDVIIHETAVVAPGTILQAASNSQIIIGPGVCLGMGVILNAYEGAIEIEEGAILGPGVLIIGNSRIGRNACIGPIATILNTSIDATSVVPPGAVVGDGSRQIAIAEEPDLWFSETPSTNDAPVTLEATELVNEEEDIVAEVETAVPEVEVQVERPKPDPSPQSPKVPVVGQVYINQLLFTLFPERQSFNRSQKNGQ